jgi:flagella basal body P-ring formation protein FlgA
MINLTAIILFVFLVPSATENSVDSFLQGYFSEYDSFEYEIISMPKGLSDISAAKIAKNTEPTVKNGFVYVPVEIDDNNRNTRRSFITLQVKLFKEVAVASRTIKNRDELLLSDFIMEQKDVANLNSGAFINFVELNEYRAKITIREGSVLQNYMIEKKPDVQINDPLEAKIVKGFIEITLDAKAKQDGSVGDIIRILSSDNKYFQAKIETGNKVLIIE